MKSILTRQYLAGTPPVRSVGNMIEYDRLNNVYIIRFCDDTDLKGWVHELNGLVFVGINESVSAREMPRLINRLLSDENKTLRKEMMVGATRQE